MPYPLTAGFENPYGPQISFQTENILPPGAVYIGPDDALILEARAPSVTANLYLTLRRLTPQGLVSSDQYQWSVSTAGLAAQDFAIPPSEGYLLSAHCRSDAVERGQLFVKLHARRNLGGQDVSLGHLFFQGYVSYDDHLGFPQSPTASSLDGRGWYRVLTPPDPPAAQEFSYTLTQGIRWILRSVRGQFTTSAAPGDRSPFLDIHIPGASGDLLIPAGVAQPPSAIGAFEWIVGTPIFSQGANNFAPLPPDLLIAGGWAIQTQTIPALAAGDQWGSFTITAEEYVAA
jgi:hypothetical protein